MRKYLFQVLTLSVFLSLLSVLSGCRPQGDGESDPNAGTTTSNAPTRAEVEAFFSDEIRSLSETELVTLGEKNALPVEWVFPNAFEVKIIRPTRFLQFGDSDKVMKFLANSPGILPFSNQFDEIELMMMSDKIAFVSLLDPKEGKVVGEHYPLSARATYIKKTSAVNQEGVVKYIGGMSSEEFKEGEIAGVPVRMSTQSMKVSNEESGKETARIEGIVTAVHFPTEDSVVIVSGPEKDVEQFFSITDGDARGVLSQRTARIDADHFDFAFLYDYLSPQKQAIQLPVPSTLAETLFNDASFFRFMVDMGAADGENAVTLAVDATSPEGLGRVDEAIGGAILQIDGMLQQAPTTTDGDNFRANFKEYADDLSGILKTVRNEKSGNRLVASLPMSEDLSALVGNFFDAVNQFAEASSENSRRSQVVQALTLLSRLVNNAYYPKNNSFPPLAITAEDGTPLLSWRVALLPLMGPEGEAFYKEFKLDQPWDGPDNIKLLDRMPVIYRSPSLPEESTKTTFQIFTGPDTPFGKGTEPLKMQDLENPGRTFMIVSVDPSKAVEWTKPDDLSFDETKLTEIFGNFVAAAPVMGEIFTAPFSGTPDEVKALGDWVYGRVTDEEDQEETSGPVPAESTSPLEEE